MNLIERLRQHAENMYVDFLNDAADALEAKDKRIAELQQEVCSLIRRDPNDDIIERQSARIAALEAALKQSHDVMHNLMGIIPWNDEGAITATTDAMRAARAAMEVK